MTYPEPEPPAEGEPLPLEPVEPEPVIDWAQFPESQIESADVTTADDFGRIAAQTAKQVILQRMREAEREIMFEEYKDRVGDIVTGVVQQADSRATIVDLGRGVEALLPGSEQVPGERYEHGARIKGVIIEVRTGTRGPQIVLSRRSDELIRKLFEMEVPEIEGGHVEIRAVAREPGYRSKIAVESHIHGVDPVGACVGPRGSRVRMVVSELRGEKIDIIPWNNEPARFLAKALSPARVREVLVDDENQQATVVVPGRPALAGDRPRGPERAPRRAPDRLARRDQGRVRVRRGGGRDRLLRRRDRRRARRPLRRGHGVGQALPEQRDPGLALLRPAGAPGHGRGRLSRRLRFARAAGAPTRRPQHELVPLHADAERDARRRARRRARRLRLPERGLRRRADRAPGPAEPLLARARELARRALASRPERGGGRTITLIQSHFRCRESV